MMTELGRSRRRFGSGPTALAALIVGAALLSYAAPARAHCRATTDESGSAGADGCPDKGKPLFWKKACVGYALSQGASKQLDFATAKSVLGLAFSTWSNASCGGTPPGIQFLDQSPTSSTTVEYVTGGSNVNLVVFRDDSWPHPEGVHNVALTTVTYNHETGEIFDADMEIDTASYELSAGEPLSGEYDLQSIATHEVGHLLGFAHSLDAESTMYAVYEPGSTAIRDLTPDDLEGLCELYRPDGTRPTAEGVVVAQACEAPSDVPCPSSTVAGCGISRGTGDARFEYGVLIAFATFFGGRRRARAATRSARRSAPALRAAR